MGCALDGKNINGFEKLLLPNDVEVISSDGTPSVNLFQLAQYIMSCSSCYPVLLNANTRSALYNIIETDAADSKSAAMVLAAYYLKIENITEIKKLFDGGSKVTSAIAIALSELISSYSKIDMLQKIAKLVDDKIIPSRETDVRDIASLNTALKERIRDLEMTTGLMNDKCFIPKNPLPTLPPNLKKIPKW